MFKVVADVEQYPRFLPWVVGLRVLSRAAMPAGHEVIHAEMAVGYGAFRERYTSRVELDPLSRSIDVVQTDGPFRQLENHWHFVPEEAGCCVHFTIEFEFRSRLLNAVAARAFGRVMLRMTDAFEARARTLSNQAVQEV
jgi:coenzyme Q-binding protein COQ10